MIAVVIKTSNARSLIVLRWGKGLTSSIKITVLTSLRKKNVQSSFPGCVFSEKVRKKL